MRALVREVLPFIVALVVALLLVAFVPELVLWLPRLAGYAG
jgi:TRAP-type C4-dicarboxylate transport system permease large subunit